jgi:6-phosphogluconate dehydrogenase
MALIAAGSAHYKWNINLAETARIWKGGCIIRARLLDPVRHAFTANPGLPNLLVDVGIATELQRASAGWRRAVAAAAAGGIPVPALAASLGYYDSYRTARLPQNLTQAQRDAFGAHKFERVERPGFVHADWGL